MKSYSLIGLLLVLSACGGAEEIAASSPPPATGQPTPTPRLQTIHINLYGDSSLEGHNVDPTQAASPTPCVALQQAFDATYLKAKVVVNCSAYGSDSNDLLIGRLEKAGAWPNPLKNLGYAPDLVLVNHALNDQRNGRSTIGYSTNLRLLSELAKAAGAKLVVFESPVPFVVTPPYGGQALIDAQPEYVAAQKQVADAVGAGYVNTFGFVKTIPNWPLSITDTIHPNRSLYALIAANRYKELTPIVDLIAK
jgi:lysophospholipase L1-like esterase